MLQGADPNPAPPPLDPIAVRRRQLEAKQADLIRHLQSLDRDSRRVPWLGALGLSAIPAGYYWGLPGVAVSLVATIFLVGSAVYLIWGHRGEYVQKVAEVREQLRRL